MLITMAHANFNEFSEIIQKVLNKKFDVFAHDYSLKITVSDGDLYIESIPYEGYYTRYVWGKLIQNKAVGEWVYEFTCFGIKHRLVYQFVDGELCMKKEIIIGLLGMVCSIHMMTLMVFVV